MLLVMKHFPIPSHHSLDRMIAFLCKLDIIRTLRIHLNCASPKQKAL